MEYDIYYDTPCGCYVWTYNNTSVCLFALTLLEAAEEVEGYVAAGQFPENMIIDEYNDDMDGDFNSAMTSAGWGTDEDYGFYGDD